MVPSYVDQKVFDPPRKNVTKTTVSKNKRAIIFDLDGTLVDTLPDIALILNRVLVEQGLRQLTQAEIRLMIGNGAQQLIKKSFRKFRLDANDNRMNSTLNRFMDYYSANPVFHSNLFSGVVNTLKILQNNGFALGICTNKPQKITEQLLEEFSIRNFFGDAVIGGDTLTVRKPNPKHLLAVVKKTLSTPKNTIMVGDSVVDVTTSRNAKIPIIIVDFGYTANSPKQLGADIVMSKFEDLPGHIENLIQKFN